MSMPRQAWGNTTGWVLASLFCAAVCFGLVTLHNLSSATPATDLLDSEAAWQRVDVPVDLGAVLKAAGPAAEGMNTAPGNGGRVYRLIINGYRNSEDNRRSLQDFLRPAVIEPSTRRLPLFNLLKQAAVYQRADIFADQPDTLVNYDRRLEELDALKTLGKAANKQAGLLAVRSRDTAPAQAEADRREATELYLAVAVLGQRLQQERITYAQYQTGAELLGGALGGLSALAQVSGDDGSATVYRLQRQALRDQMTGSAQQIWSALATINDPTNPADAADVHAGDVFALAASDKSAPMWRVEAILRTGKYRHDATRRGDAQLAERLLDRLADEITPGPERVAVAAALNLTAEQRRGAR